MDIENTIESLQLLGKDFISALETEKDAINSHDSNALLKSTDVKSALLKQFDTLDKRLHKLFNEQYNEPATSLDDYLSRLADNRIIRKWVALKEMLKKCQLLNKENEFLLSVNINHVSQAVDLMINAQEKDSHGTYSKEGYKKNMPNDGMIAKA